MTKPNDVTQNFLDSSQYQTQSILQYEAIYGEDFVSPGGRAMAIEMIGRLQLAPGSRVLDVGCGLGGSAFVMASEFGLRVDGIDLSKNMLEIANQKLRTRGLTDQVRFEWGDCLQLHRTDSYDAIYSRDVFLHIHDKTRLFSVLKSALRVGGQLLFTDYCCGPKPWSEDFTAYVANRGYSLHSPEEYGRLLAQAGFSQVVAEDVSAQFVEILRSDLDRIGALEVEQSVRDKLEHSWRQKLARSSTGDHRWGLFTAVKQPRDSNSPNHTGETT
ncbi:MAG: methyltransferase domain-containing protein [Gammaproteobacteria bacterium]|nr:methyltransferase domain-containing protein [Gammaproteobacteria bacterium]